MGIQSLTRQLDDLIAKEAIHLGNTYTPLRHPSGDLYVAFGNGDIYQFPHTPFRPYQKEIRDKLFVTKEKRFFYLVWPRRHGKEFTSWELILEAAVTDPGLYIMIYPTNVRGRMILWEGAILLEDKTSVRFRDMLPRALRAKKDLDDDMVIRLVNGSIIWVLGSDIDPEKLRGVNCRGVVCSEYAYSDPRVRLILMPILRQNGGWMLLQTTYNGQNHAYRLMQELQGNPEWECRVENVISLVDEKGQRYVTDDMIAEERRSGMPEFLIQQEYYSVVTLNQETLFFGREMQVLRETGRLKPNLWQPDRLVRMHMDIGINDMAACILEQQGMDGAPKIVAYKEDNNRTLEHYLRWAEAECIKRGLYFSELFLPHDGQKRDFNTGKNSIDFAQDLGFKATIVPRPTSKFNAIQSVRRMLYRVEIDESCSRLVDCLSNYAKEYDAKRNIYKATPAHDWTSHGVDAFQTMTLAYEASMISNNTHDIVYMQMHSLQ